MKPPGLPMSLTNINNELILGQGYNFEVPKQLEFNQKRCS